MEKPPFLSTIIVVILSMNITTNTSCSTTDQDALLAFKSTIISDPLQISTQNWTTHASICLWRGVYCSDVHGRLRVTGLELIGFHFNGTIPSHLGNLTFLTYLNFRENNFFGSLPPTLSNLHRLQYFDVGNNSFTGDIPSFGNSRHLASLNLDYNMFSGSIPRSLGNLTSLEALYVQSNWLTGYVPYEIFNVSYIMTINLESNSLSGTLPGDLCSGVLRLRELYVSYNLLSGVIPLDIYKCGELRDLSLSYNHFNGSIPESIGRLAMLEALYLGVNNFQGGIPTNVYNLARLEVLSCPGLSLTGQIPSLIFNMSSLRWIDFSNNSLSGSIDVPLCSNFPNLELLILGSNQLKGNILDNIRGCKNLSYISLSDNEFSGNIPKHLGNLTALQKIYLMNNNFNGELPAELGNLNLVEINFANNSLHGAIPSSIFNMSKLQLLGLATNNFSGHLPLTFGRWLPNLQGLHLLCNRLGGRIPSSITNASNLVTIDMGNNSFSGPMPNFGGLRLLQHLHVPENNLTGGRELRFLTSLTNCRNIKKIELSFNQLGGTIPTSIGNFSPSLEVFRAFGCRIRWSIPVEIGNLTNLQGLYLDSNELTGFIPATLAKLQRLGGLYLLHNKLQGYLPTELCQLTKLSEFFVSDNDLHGPIPACYGNLKSLQKLYLDQNKFESSVPSTLWNLNNLVALNLSKNALIGSLSPEIGNLKVVCYLDLSWNRFSGEIPSSIEKAESLVTLSLIHNEFSGHVPESLGNLRGLEFLDLSFNNLSGVIPDSLEGLEFLKFFNVSYNKLEGRIPTGGNFVNFTSQSFLQNYALCGEERLDVPPCEEHHEKMSLLPIFPFSVLTILLVLTIFLFKRRKLSRIINPSPTSHEWRKGRSYVELQQATNDFSESNLLGSGSFGSIFLGSLYDGVEVAIKVLHLESERSAKSFYTEIGVLSSLRHRNLIKILDFCSNPKFKALVLEYKPRGSLEKWLYSHTHFLDLLQRLNIALDVASALEHLHVGHTFPIVHCDLKPSNILLDEDMTALVSDFGIAKLFGEGKSMAQTRTLATIGYMAPEYGAEGIVSTSSDIYSFGIVLLELCTGKRPTDEMFGGDLSLEKWVHRSLCENNINEKVVDRTLVEGLDSSEKEQCLISVFYLAMECLVVSPADRIDIRMVVKKLRGIITTYRAIK